MIEMNWLFSAALLLCTTAVVAVDDSVYMKVADLSTAGTTANIVSMRAVIRVALNDDSVPEVDHNDHTTWTHGKTKVDLEVEWSEASGDVWKSALFGLSTKACSDADVSGSLYAYPGKTGVQGFREQLSEPRESNGKKLSYALVKDFVISLDQAPCAYIVVDSELQASVDVVPSQPEFPESFYSGIESTHMTKGYSRYGAEAYSHTCDAVSFAFYNSDVGFKRVIGDYKSEKVWHITSPNSTFPNGVCWSEAMSNRPEFIEGENGGLVSSAKFLGFSTDTAQAQYVPGGGKRVRGVPTEQWSYKTKRIPGGTIDEKLTVHLYFSTPEWHFAKSAGHRILQRVEITGHSDDSATNTSTKVHNAYDYVDFRPFLPPWSGFEPCEIMPGGDGCDCLNLGCVDEAASDRGVVTSFASPASCKAIGASTGGTSEKQKRNLLLVWFFGVLVGAILATIAALIIRKYLQRRDSSNVEQAWKEPQVGAAPSAAAGVFGSFSHANESRSDPQIEQQ